MANRRRARPEEDEFTKDDEAVAKFVRFNCSTESTLFHGNEVHYFSGNKAVDTLYESSYGTKAKGEARFVTRRSAEDFMQMLLERKMIWRAKKLVPKKKEKKEDEKNSTKSPKMAEPKGKKEKAEEKKKKKEKEEETEVDETDAEGKKKEEKDEKKKKVKLVEHPIQAFSDSNDCYVWIYDPTPFYKKVIGVLMILGAIGCCCFPLWPPIVRQGVYYLSMTGIGFFGVIIGVAILRTILFGLIWAATGGEHKLWILPNLTEDVGFFESFKPWYTYERASELDKKKKEKEDKKKTKKDKNSDDEEEKKEEEEEKKDEVKDSEESKDASQGSESVSENSEDDSQLSDEDEEENESAPSASQPRKRRPRKDDGDFVIVNK